MKVNVWITLRDDFVYPSGDPADDTQQEAVNRKMLSKATDIIAITALFKKEDFSGRTWTLYNVIYQADTAQEIEQEIQELADENPGRTRVLGAWNYSDGSKFGQAYTYGFVTRQVDDPAFNQQMVPNPNLPPYDPLNASNEPIMIPDPNWVAEDPWPQIDEQFYEVTGVTGDPTYSQYGNLLRYMPDVGDPPVAATEVTDVNLVAGQAPRDFS